MNPTEVRVFLTSLPWDLYSDADLHELYVTVMQTARTVRLCQKAKHTAMLDEQAAKRQPLTPEQIQAAIKPEHVHPPGSRRD